MRKNTKHQELQSWIGDELVPFLPEKSECSVLAIPYRINQAVAGSIAILGPMRVPYRNLFGLLRYFEKKLSAHLTDSIYKFKITFRQAKAAKQIEAK